MKFVAIFSVILIFCLADAFKKQGRKLLIPTMGKEILRPQVVNGQIAHPGQFPYMVFVKVEEEGTCGGALISHLWIITAAHCLYEKASIVVYLGSVEAKKGTASFNIGRKDMFIHPGYDDSGLNYDIALMEIPFVQYSPYIAPISLPKGNFHISSGSVAIISGWGRNSTYGRPSSTLLYTDVRVIRNEDCAKILPSIHDHQLCTMSDLGGGPCSGDSGGPLVEKTSHVLVGINSFRMSTKCFSGKPDGYTRVSSYLDWIHNHTGNLT